MISSLTSVTPFAKRLGASLTKLPITVLQINLGRRCNLSCQHCHVEAGPQRTEEMAAAIYTPLIELIQRFEQIETVDLTGGAPEMHQGFWPLVEAARAAGKRVIVRSNLTIFFEPGYEDLPNYFVQNQVQVVASLPCYLKDNVDRMRGKGVFDASIRALQALNARGYGRAPELVLDLVYNPPVPDLEPFSLTADQTQLERAYQKHLFESFGIVFNHLYTITNLPIGRTKFHLQHRGLLDSYFSFLDTHFNPATVAGLMCRNQLSVDYEGNLYDCDFNQMEGVAALDREGAPLTVQHLLAANRLDLIEQVRTESYCYGCTAGAGSSCSGAVIHD
jgi:radical SAM/Cys-rich protein